MIWKSDQLHMRCVHSAIDFLVVIHTAATVTAPPATTSTLAARMFQEAKRPIRKSRHPEAEAEAAAAVEIAVPQAETQNKEAQLGDATALTTTALARVLACIVH